MHLEQGLDGSGSPPLRSISVLRQDSSKLGTHQSSPANGSQRLQRQGSLNNLYRDSREAARRGAAAARRSLARAREPMALLHPASAFMRRWDVVTLVLLAFTATVTPFEVCFLDPVIDVHDGLFWVDRLVDLLFGVDVFINFNLAYYDVARARFITGRCQVAWDYAKSSALADVISTIPFDIIGQSVGTDGAEKLKVLRILRIFRLLKLLRVLRSSRLLMRMQDSTNVNYGHLTLLKFAAACIFISHWLACLYHLVHNSQSGDCNWVNHYYGALDGHPAAACVPEYGQVSIASRYITSLYWSVMTVSTVGYGDVPPQTDAERAFEILGMLLGASTYAYVVGSVCGVAATLSARETEHERAMDQLNRFIAEANLDGPLAMRLRAYFRFAYTATRHADWAALLMRMSPGLRGETAEAVHGSWMSGVPMLASCPNAAHVDLAFALLPLVVPPGEALLAINARADQLIAIHKGWAMVASGGGGGIRRVLGVGGVVGHELLWSNRRAAFGALTLTYVEAHAVSRERLLMVLDAFPEFAFSARLASVASALRETVRQMGLAARRVKQLAVVSAMDFNGTCEPSWAEVMEVCMPRGCSPDFESFCQLTTALQVTIVRVVAPSFFMRYTRAAHRLQRAWRARRAARMGQESDDTPDPATDRAVRISKSTSARHSWRAAKALALKSTGPPSVSLGTAALGAAKTTSPPREAASPLRRSLERNRERRVSVVERPAPAVADVASAVMAALSPQLQSLAAAQTALAADVARVRQELARSGLGLPPRAATGSMTDLAAAVGNLRRTGSGSADGNSPEERARGQRAPDS